MEKIIIYDLSSLPEGKKIEDVLKFQEETGILIYQTHVPGNREEGRSPHVYLIPKEEEDK